MRKPPRRLHPPRFQRTKNKTILRTNSKRHTRKLKNNSNVLPRRRKLQNDRQNILTKRRRNPRKKRRIRCRDTPTFRLRRRHHDRQPMRCSHKSKKQRRPITKIKPRNVKTPMGIQKHDQLQRMPRSLIISHNAYSPHTSYDTPGTHYKSHASHN